MKTKKKIIEQVRKRSQNPYYGLDGDGDFSADFIDLNNIRSQEIIGNRIPFDRIEEIVKSLQNYVWKNREQLLEDEATNDLFTVLEPKILFELLGYDFEVADTLGEFLSPKGMVEVAGYIDKSKMYAGVSSQFSMPIQNFTAAHELGHAVLHNAIGMHRDRALTGSRLSEKRDRVEIEADKFATYFLMPEKLLRDEFKNRFLSEQFVISDDSAFALISKSQDVLRDECMNLRQLARKLADSQQYSGHFFEPLHLRFKVSTEAMAIRLEELQLVRF